MSFIDFGKHSKEKLMSFFKVLFFICIYSTCLSVCASEYSFQEKSQEGARLSWSWSYCGCHLPIMETGKKNRSSARVANVLSVFPALKMPFLVTPINWSMDMFLKYGFCRFFFSWLSTFLCQVCWFMQDDLQAHMLTFSVISRGSVILFPSRQWLEAGIPPRSSHFFE